ncbi:MAG: TIGR03000 domain-containing protein [Pirellulales bacterium]|nr:TIGR03000 domain-containing protein [Pirellulales bacterium]
MIRASWKCLLIGAVVAITVSFVAPQAEAQWWGCCYRPVTWGCCYTPSYTSVGCYDSCCYGGWYLGWRPGPVRRLLFGRYKWYWGGYCYPTYDCCWTDCCTDVSTCGSASPAPAENPTPAQKPVEPPTMPAEPAPTPEINTTSFDTSGVLTVWVPYDAKVTINGLKTTSTGSRRQFVSHGLTPGFSYTYVVKAELVRDGQLLEDTRTVTLTAGKVKAVAFGFNTTVDEQVASR